jgi:hypothetical protein
MAEDVQPRKRPDRAAKLRLRQATVQTVVKSALLKYIRGSKEVKLALQAAIDKRVKQFSQRAHLASLVLSGIVKSIFANTEVHAYHTVSVPPSFLTQTFFRQLLLGTDDARIPETCIATYLLNHPNLPAVESRSLGDRNIYSHGAQTLLTNTRISLRMNIQSRLRHSLTHLQILYQWTDDLKRCVGRKILGYNTTQHTPPVQIPEDVAGLIQYHRKILGLREGDVVDAKWLERDGNLLNVLRYYVYLNRLRETSATEETPKWKAFDVVPMAKIRRRFITVDADGIFGVLKECRLVGGSMTGFRANLMEHWLSILNVEALQGHHCTFSGTIETDGISLCTHFLRPKGSLDAAADTIQITPDDRVIAIDPGRSNIFYAVEKLPNGEVKRWKLTRAQYYHDAGMSQARHQTQVWLSSIQESLAELSTVSTKGAHVADHESYLAVLQQQYDTLWTEALKPRWARQRLRLYGGKKRVFAAFFKQLKSPETDERRTLVAFGAGSFCPGGAGETSVPTTRAFRECRSRFVTKVIDEFRTTKIHWETDRLLHKVGKKSSPRTTVRGLLWCGPTISSEGKFVNRDLNGAMNILRCAVGERPAMLRRSESNTQLVQRIETLISVKCQRSNATALG